MQPIVLINPETDNEICVNLLHEGFNVVPVPPCNDVALPLSGHVDLQVFYYNNRLFCHSGIDKDFIKIIKTHVEVTICDSVLSPDYPDDIAFNIACTGSVAFHRFDCADASIKSYLQNNGVELIDVSQGYSKCSTLIVDEKNVITADKSIHSAAESAGLNSLCISPGHVSLPGYPYGFIGGASGMYGNTVYFTGSLAGHPDGQKIINFIKNAGKSIVNLRNDQLLDLGSLIIIPHNHQYQ